MRAESHNFYDTVQRRPAIRSSMHSHQPLEEVNSEDISRSLRVSSSHHTRLHRAHKHPRQSDTDSNLITMPRTVEPEAVLEATVHYHALPWEASKPAQPHLYSRPTPRPKASWDNVSSSSASSYAASTSSSSFTLSSDSTGSSSAPSALFDSRSKPSSHTSSSTFSSQLKALYRTIKELEARIKGDGADASAGWRESADEELERESWRTRIADHKRLADTIHNILEMTLAPAVPDSLRSIPTKYNLISCLWNTGFHHLLESLRRASFTSPLALEHLQDFIYYAYTFYTGLYEERTLGGFKSDWIEALGDLARYRTIVATMVQSNFGHGVLLTAAALSGVPGSANQPAGAEASSDINSQEPSIGVAAARLLDVLPEKERWRKTAQGWYGKGIADTPGNGRLHHCLALLSQEVEDEELRTVYHFVKSMTTLHPFLASREAGLLPIWSPELQARRLLPGASVSDLFILLHGMLFTASGLDNFDPILVRLLEKIAVDGAEEKDWIMMAVLNIGAVLEYGNPEGTLKQAGIASIEDFAPQPQSTSMKDEMDVDEVNIPTTESEAKRPITFSLAVQLMSAMLSQVLRDPIQRDVPNPLLTVLLTFLATILKNEKAAALFKPYIPWSDLANFFSNIPSHVTEKALYTGERWTMLTTRCAPLREDWCIRAMAWVGRKVFERGYWSREEDRLAELELLDDTDDSSPSNLRLSDARWTRIIRCAIGIANVVDGFSWVEAARQCRVDRPLAEKLQRGEGLGYSADGHKRYGGIGRRWDGSMDVDEELATSLITQR
ncbi:hypothetical protein EYR40_001189 [Pleurotus pulmonarius]|nr:hypothetical protein EYR36_000468 [Pleurotus pulmonarius]KAF4604005.1 hypothetical protein EYR38_004427 [Pleurotus pulmonarius]KAF4608836.1 hypothetical protein EYR40_001189 [Pleurotus pulmonarius]